jgi:hypothetical protein
MPKTKTTTAPTKAQGKLVTIAADMRQFIERSGARWVHRRLSHGLEMVLQNDERQWRLALARNDVPPSAEEIAICQKAFNVPAGTEATLIVKERQLKKGPAKVEQVHVAEMYWTEQE